jgi:hypothetical protein
MGIRDLFLDLGEKIDVSGVKQVEDAVRVDANDWARNSKCEFICISSNLTVMSVFLDCFECAWTPVVRRRKTLENSLVVAKWS